jgi:hypothetical protein
MKSNLQEQIEKICEFLCLEFGTEGRSIAFKLDILSKLLQKEDLEDKEYLEFCAEMSEHGYGTLIINDSVYMMHFTLLNSIYEINEEVMHLKFADFDKIPLLPDTEFNKHMH